MTSERPFIYFKDLLYYILFSDYQRPHSLLITKTVEIFLKHVLPSEAAFETGYYLVVE